MTIPNNPQQTLAELLTALETAASAKDRTRAFELEQEILNCIANEEAESDRLGQQLHDLHEELERSLIGSSPSELDTLEGNANLVWFCTNRKVTLKGGRRLKSKVLAKSAT